MTIFKKIIQDCIHRYVKWLYSPLAAIINKTREKSGAIGAGLSVDGRPTQKEFDEIMKHSTNP